MASPSRTAAKEFVDLFEATFSERLERWRLKAEAYEAKLTERGQRLDDRDGRTTAAPGEEAGATRQIHPWDGIGCRVAPEAGLPADVALETKMGGPVGPLKALPCPETSVGGASSPVEGSPTPRLAFAIGAGPYPVGFRLAFALAVLLGG
jgi:hypothetical protein